MHRRRVETGEPHVPDDHQLQGVRGVLRPQFQVLADFLGVDVRLITRRVVGGPGHDDFDLALLRIGVVPRRPQLGDLLVQAHRDTPGGDNDHRLAVQRFPALLPVLDDVGGDLVDTFLGADDRLQPRPPSTARVRS